VIELVGVIDKVTVGVTDGDAPMLDDGVEVGVIDGVGVGLD